MAFLYKAGRPSKKEPPAKAGEYRWRSKESGEIEYIGETSDLKRRRKEHERSNKPVSRETHDFEWKVADGRFSVDKRRKHEAEKIEKHKPILNLRAGGAGRK